MWRSACSSLAAFAHDGVSRWSICIIFNLCVDRSEFLSFKVEACLAAMKSDKVKEALKEVKKSIWCLQTKSWVAGDWGSCGQGSIWCSNNVLHRGGAGGGDVLGLGQVARRYFCSSCGIWIWTEKISWFQVWYDCSLLRQAVAWSWSWQVKLLNCKSKDWLQ